MNGIELEDSVAKRQLDNELNNIDDNEHDYETIDGYIAMGLNNEPIEYGQDVYEFNNYYMTDEQRWQYIKELLQEPNTLKNYIGEKTVVNFLIKLASAPHNEIDPNELLDFELVETDRVAEEKTL